MLQPSVMARAPRILITALLANAASVAAANIIAADPAAPPPAADTAPAPSPTVTPKTVAAPAKAPDFDEVLRLALHGPRGQMARADTDAAEARSDEADAARMPTGKATAFATVSPEISCDGPAETATVKDCSQTDPKNFALKFSGGFFGASIEIDQPIYTFGKIHNARLAAQAGVAAQKALEDESAGDTAVDVARAYWGLKLARELGYMLDDGVEQIAKAIDNLDERAKAPDGGDVSVQDRQRVRTLLAEGKSQRVEASQGELSALAAIRALTSDDKLDIDDSELTALRYDLPTDDVAAVEQSSSQRPQARAAAFGAKAFQSLADFEASKYWPDLAVVVVADTADAQGVDTPPSAFAYNPYNTTGAGIVLAMRWQIDPWGVHARTERAEALARKASEQANLAVIGAKLDARAALAEARSAKAKIAAATDGESAARTWLAAVLQADAVGTAEARDLADSYLAWFQMRARLMNAIYQWNVAVIRLRRAAGEFHAPLQRH